MPSFANDPGGPQFRAPGFLQPKTFEAIDRIPQSFDEMFDRVAKAKAFEEQKKIQKKNEQNFFAMQSLKDPTFATESQFSVDEQRQRLSQAQQPAPTFETDPRDVEFSGQQPGETVGAFEDQGISELRNRIEQMEQQKSFASREQEAGLAKTEAETAFKTAQTQALGKEQIFVDPLNGKLITVPKGAKLLPRGTGLSAGEKKVDETFAKDFSSWVSGGFADAQKGIKQIGDAITTLSGDSNLTGPVAGSVPFQAITKPKSKAVQEDVEEVVQRNLRLILGAQFTENEGKRLIERAFNPKLQEAENIRRLKRLSKQMSDAARAKNEAVEYFQENGTLKGFKGKIYTQSMQFIEEFEAGLTLDKSDYEAEARKRGLIK